MIIGFYGGLSGGKTISMIRTAINEQRKTQKRIITNMRLKNCRNFYMSNDDTIQFLQRNYQDQDAIKRIFANSIIVWDELTTMIDARKSTTNLNTLMTLFMMMLHKIDANPVLYTSQVPSSMIDLRLREITDAWARCKRIDKYGNIILSTERKMKTDILIRIDWEIILDPEVKQFTEIFDPKEFYDSYDTTEIILLDREKYLSRR